MNFKILVFGFIFLTSPRVLADSHLELEYVHSSLTAGLSAWNDMNLRSYSSLSSDNQIVIEGAYKNHFNQSALLGGATLTHNYDPSWYQDFSLTKGTNPQIIPQTVLFTEIHRKFLSDQSLIAGLGLGYVASENPYTDTEGLLELTYYTQSFFSYQVGMRLNQSHPGTIMTFRYFGVFNFLQTNAWEAFVKFETGREGYTVISSNNFKNEFSSTGETLQVHRWLNEKYGVGTNIDLYQSAFYNRASAALTFLVKY